MNNTKSPIAGSRIATLLALLCLVIVASSFVSIGDSGPNVAFAASTSAVTDSSGSGSAYAQVGAYAFYTVQGGFVAFFDGIAGNMTYTVTDVFSNGTMSVQVRANTTAGTEINPTYQIFNYTDSISSPRVFPVAPVTELGANQLVFQNLTCNLVGMEKIEVPAGAFNTVEYEGTVNGTTIDFWFDSVSGLAVQEYSQLSTFQLHSSNIATPVRAIDPLQADIPYAVIFVIVAVVSVVSFFGIRNYYAKEAKRASDKGAKRTKPEKGS